MTPEDKGKFTIGQWIIHHHFGVGKIKAIKEKGLGEERKAYYEVETKNNTYWLPVGDEGSNRVEPIRNKNDFKEALEILAEKPKEIDKNNKSRINSSDERWNEGTLESRARLLRDLNGQSNWKSLNFNERQLFNKIRSQFIEEWLLVKPSLDQNEAQQIIQQALLQSAEKDDRN